MRGVSDGSTKSPPSKAMSPSSRKVDVAFWFLGLVNNFSFVMFLTAAEDLLQGYAGLTLVCTVVPGFLSRLVLSTFAHDIPYLYRILTQAIAMTIFSLIAAQAHSVTIQFIALCFQAVFGALGEISFLALTSKFPNSNTVVGSWASGTGAAGIAAAGAYIFCRDVLKLSSRYTLTLWSPLPLLLIFLYQAFLSGPADFNPVPDSPVHRESPISPENDVTKRQYLKPLICKYMLPLAIVYFAEYTINQGVLGTLTEYRDKKKYDVEKMYSSLQFTYQVAVFISRSSISIIQIQRLWILPVLQVLNLILLIMCTIFVWLPSSVFSYGIVFWEGLLGGLTYVNAFSNIRNETPTHLKEWALGLATVGDAAGVSLAALVSLWLEQAILNFRAAG